MHMLESAMAFAVVMIIFSTIVTGLVEAILRLLALKQKSLGQALTQLLTNEVQPALIKALEQAKASKKGLDQTIAKVESTKARITSIVDSFTSNPLTDDASGWWSRRLKKIDELTTYSFLQRLAKSEMADAITELDDDQLAAYLANISRTYERYVAASHELYRKWSYVVTTAAAMIFAIAYNVDAGRVYVHLMDDPATRTALIEQADQAMEANRKAVQSLQVLLGEAEDQNLAAKLQDKSEKQVLDEIAATRIALDSLREDSRLPVGPSLWPYCMGQTLLGCDKDRAATPLSLDFAFWVLNVILAGVLIGLGGPFWSKVYSRLAQLAGRIPGMRGNEELVDGGVDAPPEAKKAANDHVAAFRIAARDVTVKVTPPETNDQTG